MRMHKNEITFDTCGCQVQMQKDLDVEGSRMEFMHFLKKCPAHAQMNDPDAWGKCWLNTDSEQHRKNDLYKALTVTDPLGLGAGLVKEVKTPAQRQSAFWGRGVTVFDTDGSPVMETNYELIGGIECYVWLFDANRCLCLCFDGCLMDAAKKQELQNYCDATWGADTVRVLNAGDED